MTKFTVSTLIRQPVEIVVKALMNPENHPYWNTDLKRFEVVQRKPGDIGSVAHLHYVQKGRSYILEDRLIYCEMGKRYVSQVTGDAITAQVETILQARGNQTEMTITWSGKGRVLFLKLLLPFLRRKMIKQSQAELERFKKLVETKGPDFGGGENAMNL